MEKVAIALDGLLCDTDALKEEWLCLMQDEKFLNDAPFWAALKPYDDVRDAIQLLSKFADIYVMCERPKGLFLPTRAWLRKNADLRLNKDRLIVPAIKRYDCRILGISHFVDSDPAVIENLKVETVFPITTYLCDRSQGESLVNVVEKVVEGIRL